MISFMPKLETDVKKYFYEQRIKYRFLTIEFREKQLLFQHVFQRILFLLTRKHLQMLNHF